MGSLQSGSRCYVVGLGVTGGFSRSYRLTKREPVRKDVRLEMFMLVY